MTVSFYVGLFIGMVLAPLIRYELIPWMRFRWTIRRQRYAQGGETPAGYTVVDNDTGIPEPVLTPDDLKRIARERQGGDQ